ncbi:MAG: signal recognition particle-docking protein FtsY [Candidatus Cloacimonadota bacterium]|nr:signal recognition particle-docking protein FtsY [Candidatus Cloacimonadota bacterium]
MKVVSGLKYKLAKTHNSFVKRITEAIHICGKVDEELIENIEDILIQADIGLKVTNKIINILEDEIRLNKITNKDDVFNNLENIIINILNDEYKDIQQINFLAYKKPIVILFVGVNGVGKTTTIAKVANKFKKQSKKVLLVAADTFRAAAIEQLEIWAKRIGVNMISQKYGSDPSSVIFNALHSAMAQNYDVVMIDTAGRLHTKTNLMRELEKNVRTIKKIIPDAPHESYLIIDSTTGQNGVQQAKSFVESIPITGVILTKLDGTAKGGVALGIKDSLNIPVKAIGIGEKVEDIREFNANDFVKAIFN